SDTDSLDTARTEPRAAALLNGRVLVVGGLDDDDAPVRASELYVPTAWQPVVTGPSAIQSGVTVTGSGFRGVSGGSGGGVNDSPTDFPFVSLRPLEGGAAYAVPFSDFSETGVTVQVPAVPDGDYVLGVTVGGVTATKVVQVDAPPPAP